MSCLKKTKDKDVWMMYDPDFRWEGEMEKVQILNAVRSPDVGEAIGLIATQFSPLQMTR